MGIFHTFYSVSTVEFEQLNVTIAEISDVQKPSEIAAQKKRLRSKAVFPKKKFLKVTAFSRREQLFFRVQCFFISQKYLRPSVPQWKGFFKKEHLHP